MKETDKTTPEASRLEGLWAGQFGNAYIDRNKDAGEGRERFWKSFLSKYTVGSALEVGCNIGGNLRWIAPRMKGQGLFAVDINPQAVREIRKNFPDINVLCLPARQLCFRDAYFDLVFTAGVLIHQPESTLPLVMSEIVRCSRKYVLCLEYYALETVEIPYREQTGALFKRDYGTLYQNLFPELVLLEKGELGKNEGWDDVTYWVFSRERENS